MRRNYLNFYTEKSRGGTRVWVWLLQPPRRNTNRREEMFVGEFLPNNIFIYLNILADGDQIHPICGGEEVGCSYTVYYYFISLARLLFFIFNYITFYVGGQYVSQ